MIMNKERKKELEWAFTLDYTKIELVQNVYVQKDGKIGAELSELKLEELDKLDDGVNLIVTNEFNLKTIYEYYKPIKLRHVKTFEEENHFRLFPALYVIRNKGFYINNQINYSINK